MDWKKMREEIRKEKITKKQKRKQVYKMLFAALLVGGIFVLGYVIIIVAGLFFFSS